MTNKRIVVAIDGPAGSGKSTIARRVAARMGFVYIDTGAMYRAVGLEVLREGLGWDDVMSIEDIAEQVDISFAPVTNAILVNGHDASEAIRDPAVSDAASRVSTLAGVRRALVARQRALASEHSVVMEGRDIGTVVFPDAQVKIYLDADDRVRSERRAAELEFKGLQVERGLLSREIAERDRRDKSRADSPLLQAPDAIYLDTSSMTLDQVEESVLDIIRRKTSNGKEVVQ
jgi:cytidylate kinase